MEHLVPEGVDQKTELFKKRKKTKMEENVKNKMLFIIISHFVMPLAQAGANPVCKDEQASLVYENRIEFSNRVIYINPAFLYSPGKQIPILADSQGGTRICRAFQHNNGIVGETKIITTKTQFAYFETDGSLSQIFTCDRCEQISLVTCYVK